MDFASMGRTLVASEGTPVHIVAPDGVTPLYAVKSDGVWVVTTDPDAPGALPCTMTVIGQDSRAYRRRRHEIVDAMKARQKAMKAAQLESENLKLVASAVTGWSNIPWEGALMDYSDDNLLKFLDFYRPAFDQINEHIMDRSNFLSVG